MRGEGSDERLNRCNVGGFEVKTTRLRIVVDVDRTDLEVAQRNASQPDLVDHIFHNRIVGVRANGIAISVAAYNAVILIEVKAAWACALADRKIDMQRLRPFWRWDVGLGNLSEPEIGIGGEP